MKATSFATLLRTLLLWLLLEVIAAAQVSLPGGGTVLRSWLTALAHPAQTLTGWLGEVGGFASAGLRDQRSLAAEALAIRRQLELLQAETSLLREDLKAVDEASALQLLIPLLADRCVAARCLFRHPGLGRMQVSAGAVEGVRADTAVMSAGGLVGRVTRVDARTSWVELITHPAAAVAVEAQEGRVQGLAVGTGSGLSVEYVPRSAELLRGSILSTSGADGIYPPGLPVARVSSVRESELPYLLVRAMPLAEFTSLRAVLLLPYWPPAQPAPRVP